MYIEKIIIENFKCFAGRFDFPFHNGLNIVVGDNEVGKSTILEAVHLALTGWFHGKHLHATLTQSLFNQEATSKYIASLKTDEPLPPPELLIELHFNFQDEALTATFNGNNNLDKDKKGCGIQFFIKFNDKYRSEYNELLADPDEVLTIPIEYYDYGWTTFSRDDRVTPKSIPIKSSFIDSSSSKYQNGSDIYMSRIVRDFLDDSDKVAVAQAHRKMKDAFANDQSVEKINTKMDKAVNLSNKKMRLAADTSTKTAWESSLITQVDDIPFQFIGKGEQSLIKTKLAISQSKEKEMSCF